MTRYSIYLFIIIVSCCFAGCSADLAQRCASLYPCRDSIIVSEKIIHDSIPVGPWWLTVSDSVKCPVDTVERWQTFTKTITVPVRKVEFKYLVRDTCFLRIDEAAISQLQATNSDLRRQLEKEKVKAAKVGPWRLVSIILISLLVLALAYIIGKMLKR